MKNRIVPCVCLGSDIITAVRFYCETFSNTKIKHRTKSETVFEIGDFTIVSIESSFAKRPNATMSFLVICETEHEINTIWEKLADNGNILLPFETYPWSTKYGWVEDKFGVSWQLSLGKISDIDQKITPMLMYNGSQYGKAEEAIEFYTAIFKKSGIQTLLRYQGRAEFQNGKISHGQFSLLGKNLAAMDIPISQDLSFSKGNSFVVNCETQVEVDYYLNELSLHKGKSRNGWVEDKYGVWWQITLLKQELN